MTQLRTSIAAASLVALSLTGCQKGDAVPPETDMEVRAFFRNDGHPAAVEKLWLAGSSDNPLVCGRMGPVMDGTRHRFYYDRRGHYGQVEMTEKVIATTGIGVALVAQNRELFNDLWKNHCEPSEPIL
jgi:hypothetical protein